MSDGEPSLRLTDVTTTLDMALTALRAADADLDYRVGGTSAALLQGVHLPVGDIDLLVARREDVDTFAAALEAYPCLYPASWISEAMQYFARYEINGVELEISTVEWPADSDGMENVGPGPWRHYVVVTCGSHRVPVIRLELRLTTEILRDRPDRYEPLIDHMSAHGFDPDLLYLAMNARRLPAERWQMVQDRLAGALPA